MKPYFKIIIALGVIATLFIARLAYLQLFTDRYALNAANTSIKIDYIIPQRGVIFDRNGKILVGNQPSYELSFTKALMKPNFDTIGFCKLVGITKEDFKARILAIQKEKYYSKLTPMTFMKDLGREEIARIQEVIFNFPAFSIVSRPQRRYEVSTSGNLLGYTNEVNDAYIKRDSLYYLPGDLAGMSGIEKAYETVLRGEKGMKYIQKDIKLRNVGPYKNGSLDKEVVSGKDLVLTIDYDLQKMAEEMLANKRGAIVALDPNNGEILAMATGPDIDPNEFTGAYKKQNLYRLLNDSMNKPMFDRSVQAAYPPGSPFKLMTALAAYQMKVISDSTRYTCRGGFHYGNRKIGCHCGTYWPIGMEKAIEKSCNNYFSRTHLAILNKYPNDPTKSVNEWQKILNSFGLGVFLNNDLAFGSKGQIPGGAFYKKYFGEKWRPMQAVFNGMGQGEVLLTPMQMANFTAAIANEGFYFTPHIVKSIDGEPNPDPRFKEKKQTLVDKKYFSVVKRGMFDVFIGGTARALKSKDFTQLGKTGTAQVPQGKDNSIFVLAAPADKPKIVVVSVIEHAGFGATWAGPACTVIAEKFLLGELKRENLYKKMTGASFMGEYRRQWITHLKKIGKYEPPKPDSIQLKKLQDSLKIINDKKKLELDKKKLELDKKKKDSIMKAKKAKPKIEKIQTQSTTE